MGQHELEFPCHAGAMPEHGSACAAQLTFSEAGGSGGAMFSVQVHMRSLHDGTVFPSGVGKVRTQHPAWTTPAPAAACKHALLHEGQAVGAARGFT
jgi:hypothetical protein